MLATFNYCCGADGSNRSKRHLTDDFYRDAANGIDAGQGMDLTALGQELAAELYTPRIKFMAQSSDAIMLSLYDMNQKMTATIFK